MLPRGPQCPTAGAAILYRIKRVQRDGIRAPLPSRASPQQAGETRKGEYNMIVEDERKIIEAEITRLEKRWEEAQELYGITGSPSTDRTMHKYDVLKNALENYLYDRRLEAKEKSLVICEEQLRKLKKRIELLKDSGLIAGNVAEDLLRIIRGS